MAAYYIYLISSLPMLHFGAKAPFSFEKFIMMCKGLIPEQDVRLLEEIGRGEEHIHAGFFSAIEKWHRFDTALRNELVKIRAGRRHIDPGKYLRQDGYTEPSVSRIALNAHRNPSVLEAEKMFDQERWHFLDEIAAGHYFDIDVLVIYAYKLLIMERWDRVRGADSEKLLEENIAFANR